MQLSSFLLGVLLIVGVYEVHQASSDQLSDPYDRPECDARPTRRACERFRYRTFDGRCNNLCNTARGAAETPFARFLPPAYQNGLGPRSVSVVNPYLPLTNARTISNTVFQSTTENVGAAPSFTHMTMAWGSFIDHDFTLTASNQTQGCGTNTESCPTNVPGCVSIPISQANPDDRLTNNEDVKCIPLSRSAQYNGEQMNLVSSYIDGSNIYGANCREAETVRDRQANMGLLRVVPLSIPGSDEDRLPISPPLTAPGTFCRSPRPSVKPCFLFGDFRDNENPTLMTLHILLTREHNRIARIFHDLNPHWTEERLFQEARKIVIAHLQHITYNEWLAVLFSEDVRRDNGILLESPGSFSDVYDQSEDVTTFNSFVTAAFRMGHSLIGNSFGQFDEHFIQFGQILVTTSFFDPSPLYEENGIDSIHLGLARELAQQLDRNFVPAIHEGLVMPGPGDGTRADLLAINIMRGRDQGLAPYVDFRAACGLGATTTFGHLLANINVDQVRRIRRQYVTHRSIPGFRFLRDIDLYVGGISENPQTGSIMGQTFTCLIARSFQRYRAGDRFWYERNDPYTGFNIDQLDSIRSGSSLAKLICDNSDIVKEIQPNVFQDSTDVVPCDDIPSIDLNLWQEEPGMEHQSVECEACNNP